MRAVVVDRDIAFVTDSMGSRALPSKGLTACEGDVVAGGQEGMRISEAMASVRPDSGYSNVIIQEGMMFFTDRSAPIMLPRAAKAMYGCALDGASVERIDKAIETLAQFGEDDIWDEGVTMNGVEFAASDCLASVRMIRDAITGSVTDTTMRTMVYGRICAYRAFRGNMPGYVECMTPMQLSERLYEKYGNDRKE